jgi:hypothetical protein
LFSDSFAIVIKATTLPFLAHISHPSTLNDSGFCGVHFFLYSMPFAIMFSTVVVRIYENGSDFSFILPSSNVARYEGLIPWYSNGFGISKSGPRQTRNR